MLPNSQILSLRFDCRLKNYSELIDLLEDTSHLVAVFDWKTQIARELPPIWCAMGGTGTGKSTIVNSLLSSDVSNVGVKRPCTMTAAIFAQPRYEQIISQTPLIFEGPQKQAELLLLSKTELEKIVLIDTPDFDSIASENKVIAARLMVIADVILFVTSQEKYGDLICRQMLEESVRWGKKIVLILNKVSSEEASEEFAEFSKTLGPTQDLVLIPRVAGMPKRIDGFRQYPQIREFLDDNLQPTNNADIKSHELKCLKTQTIYNLNHLQSEIDRQKSRILELNSQIDKIASSLADELNKQLDAIVSQDVEKRMKMRLQALLRKYDILFVPRLMFRNAISTVIGYLSQIIFSKEKTEDAHQNDKDIRFEDFANIESMAPLGQLDMSIANLNLQVAQLLVSNDRYEDLKLIVLEDAERFDFKEIKSMYEEAFPGLENLLETEFERMREGLTRFDEIKLYGSYTLWAILLITFEIVIGGGLTLLDLLLNSVIVPFIPKWMLDLKILDILKSIAQRVDAEHKRCLRNILFKQASLYTECLSSLLPDEQTIADLENLRLRLSNVEC